MEAWICPRCGRANAPWVAFCCCKAGNMEVITGDGTGTPLPEMPQTISMTTNGEEKT